MSNRSTTASSSSASTKVNRTSAGSSSRQPKEKPQQGTVIAAGHGKSNDDGQRVPLDVKVGDTILFGKYSGQEIKLDGDEYVIMREDEVLTVIEEGDIRRKKRRSNIDRGPRQAAARAVRGPDL